MGSETPIRLLAVTAGGLENKIKSILKFHFSDLTLNSSDDFDKSESSP